MNKRNQLLFNELSEFEFFKTNKKAEKQFRSISSFPDALGFDEETHGFLVLHRNHSNSALENEIPICVFLKQQGYGVILIEEIKSQLSADVEIEGRLFEIKRISNAKNIQNAVKFQFRTAYTKSNNLILWVDQKVNFMSLKSAIVQNAKNYSKIQCLWLLCGETFLQLNRKEMLNGDF